MSLYYQRARTSKQAERPGGLMMMDSTDGVWPRPAMLIGRRLECRALDRLAGAVRGGESRALVVRGDMGVGKTALLGYLAGRATGCRVARAAGTQSEMELAFAGLHQLFAPMLDRLENLPAPQQDALRIAFGMSPGPAPTGSCSAWPR